MKPSSSIARATSGWISSSPNLAIFASVTRSFLAQVSRLCSLGARVVPHRAFLRHRRARASLLVAHLLLLFVQPRGAGFPRPVPRLAGPRASRGRDQWPTTPVDAVMTPASDVASVGPDEPLSSALEKFGADLPLLPVLRDGT